MLEELGLDFEFGEESNELEDDLSNFILFLIIVFKFVKKKLVFKYEFVFVDIKGVVKCFFLKYC